MSMWYMKIFFNDTSKELKLENLFPYLILSGTIWVVYLYNLQKTSLRGKP